MLPASLPFHVMHNLTIWQFHVVSSIILYWIIFVYFYFGGVRFYRNTDIFFSPDYDLEHIWKVSVMMGLISEHLI